MPLEVTVDSADGVASRLDMPLHHSGPRTGLLDCPPMNADDELAAFVRESLLRGVPRAQVEGVLAQAGWRPEQVRRALGTYADVAFPVPVPRPRPYLSARDAFLYLVLFTALYITAFNLGALLFTFIERAFRSEEHTSELQSLRHLVCRLLL